MTRNQKTTRRVLCLEALEDRCLLAAGDLDPAFGSGGIVTTNLTRFDQALALAIYPTAGTAHDGKIVLAWSTRNGASLDTVLVRFNVDGSLDTTFGANGTALSSLPSTDEYVSSVALQADGKMVVVGSQNNSFFAARFLTNGSPDPTYGANGIATTAAALSGHATAVAVQSDSKVTLAGYTIRSAGSTNDYDFGLSRFLGDAALSAESTPAAAVQEALEPRAVEALLKEAISRWQATGVDTSSLNALGIRIADLGGATLGMASGNTIWLDDNAAGWGWFLDATPWDDSEFTTPGNQGEQDRMDLLTVVMHELGHVLGFDHSEPGALATGDVMLETLAAGVRRTDNQHDDAAVADQIFSQTSDPLAFAGLRSWLSEELESTPRAARRR